MATTNQKIINLRKTAFEAWAKQQFCLFLGITKKQFEELVDWGKDTGKLIYTPKSALEPDLANIKISQPQVVQKPKRLVFAFDVILATAWILGGFEECQSTKRDRFGRWARSNSIVSQSGFADKPYINAWITQTRSFLQDARVKTEPLWPKGKTWAVVTSHDVEGLNFNLGKALQDVTRGIIQRDRGLLRFSLIKLASAIIFTLTDGGRFKQGFDDLLETLRDLKLKSSIFLCGAPKKADYLSFNDPDYDIRDQEALASARKAMKMGLSLGVHPVTYTAPYKTRYAEQIGHLATSLKTKVNTSRHHYWNLTRTDTNDAWAAMSRAGIKYDTSLSFYDAPNFRRSIALPFEPFDIKNSQIISLIEIPSTFMDQWSTKYALADHLNLVKKLAGVAVLDWHSNRFSHEYYKKQRDLFINTIKRLRRDPKVWLTNIAEAGSWWEKRTKKLGWD